MKAAVSVSVLLWSGVRCRKVGNALNFRSSKLFANCPRASTRLVFGSHKVSLLLNKWRTRSLKMKTEINPIESIPSKLCVRHNSFEFTFCHNLSMILICDAILSSPLLACLLIRFCCLLSFILQCSWLNEANQSSRCAWYDSNENLPHSQDVTQLAMTPN